MFRRHGLMAAFLSMASLVPGFAVPMSAAVLRAGPEDLGTKATRYRRSRGSQAKPKKHRNRNTISRRVRRKHRRAV